MNDPEDVLASLGASLAERGDDLIEALGETGYMLGVSLALRRRTPPIARSITDREAAAARGTAAAHRQACEADPDVAHAHLRKAQRMH